MDRPPRVLLLMPKTTYRAEDFLAAARRLGVEVRVGSDRCHVLAGQWGVPLALDFRHPEAAAAEAVAHARSEPFDAVVPTDDRSTEVASLVARALGLRANPPEAARAARDKLAMRERLAAGGLPVPPFRALPAEAGEEAALRAGAEVGYPCVVKPRLLSGSRGVIRADGPAALVAAFARARTIAAAADVPPSGDPAARALLVEGYVPGPEVALEGLLVAGELRTLALFDKPDPLEGPYFEETLYVTPSRLPRETQESIAATAARAARALGLEHGPVHAELRLRDGRAWPIEVAGRSIGGLCSRTLHFGTGHRLEELVLADALGRDLPPHERERRAAGVLMIPIPRRGFLRDVRGRERALAVPGAEAIEITAPADHELVPLPEGASYLGFAFARGESPEDVERALREAHARLEVVVAPTLTVRA